MECELMHWYEVRNDKGLLSATVVLGRIKCFQAVRLQPILFTC
jgi:hypothetical protein